MTVYAPKGTNTGAAVVVFPGGGYMSLAEWPRLVEKWIGTIGMISK